MITRAQMPRQLRNMGGITNAVPREKYGLGSKIKDRFRKLIPNELADIAVKAAPFVAPFNPGIAGLMRGIGRFDQRGSLSDAFKQGIGTYAFGKAAGPVAMSVLIEFANLSAVTWSSDICLVSTPFVTIFVAVT